MGIDRIANKIMQRQKLKITAALCISGLLSGCFGFSATTSYWDSKVDEMCAADGGGRILINEELPREEYSKLLNSAGELNISLPETALKAPYFEKYSSKTIKEGNPSITSEKYEFIRRSDRAVIATHVSYTRWGGEFSPPTLSHSGIPNHRCPSIKAMLQFFSTVIKERRP